MEIYTNTCRTFQSDDVHSTKEITFHNVSYFCLISSAPPSMSIRLYRLHFEILQFYHFMTPTDAEHAVRQQVVNRITDVINRYLPTASVRKIP